MLSRMNFLLCLSLLVGSTQGKTLSLFQVDDTSSSTTTTETTNADSRGFLDEDPANESKPMSLLEKARLMRERRELYRRSLQGGMSFTNMPTSPPTISGVFPTAEPTIFLDTEEPTPGGKAGPYRTLSPTRGLPRTSSPTAPPTAEPTVGLPKMPTSEPTIGLPKRPRIPAIILIKKKLNPRPRPTGGDDSGKGDYGDDSGKGDGDDSGKGDGDDSGKGDGDDSGKGGGDDSGKGDSDAQSSEVEADDDEPSTEAPQPAPQPAPESSGGGGASGALSRVTGRSGRFGSRRNLRQGSEGDNVSDESASTFSQFDFLVAGFPKCGTTTLLKAFQNHTETAMPPQEQCAFKNVGSDAAALQSLDETLETLSDAPEVKRSFKCPTAVYNQNTISRMQKHSPAAKFVIGVRHPVWMLQSFYNYRVTEIYQRRLNEAIPSFEEVMARDQPWKGVSVDATRFDLFLMQFAKTHMSTFEMSDLMGHPGYDIAIRPNNFEIFLYDIEQLDDEDAERSAVFRQELSNFLDLSKPLAPFGRENTNHFVGNASFDETIDICDSQHSALRRQLVEQGRDTAHWLTGEFIHSNEVTVANEEHLISSLRNWGTDPCLNNYDRGAEHGSNAIA